MREDQNAKKFTAGSGIRTHAKRSHYARESDALPTRPRSPHQLYSVRKYNVHSQPRLDAVKLV